MTKLVTIKCDSCSKEIGYTSYASEYYLSLNSVRMPCSGGAVFAMDIPSPISGDKHFCGTTCIKNWIDKNIK